MNPFIRTLALAAASLSVSFTLVSCGDQCAITESATVEELGQMNRDFAQALRAKDAAAAASLYAEEASLSPPNEPIVTGRANIQEYWQGLIDAGLIDATVKTIDARSDGDLGCEIGTFALKLSGGNGEAIIEEGKYTEILQRTTDGKWGSLYGMWSHNE